MWFYTKHFFIIKILKQFMSELYLFWDIQDKKFKGNNNYNTPDEESLRDFIRQVREDIEKAQKTDLKALGNLNALTMNVAENYNIRTVLLTSSSVQRSTAFSKTNKLLMQFFYADAVPLKSMVRANPGILLLKDGIVINKWHYHSIPSYDELAKTYFDKQ